MKKYFKGHDTFMCFDLEEKSMTSATSSPKINNKALVYTQDEVGFERMYEHATQMAAGNGTPGPNTTGWAEITEEIFNQVKEDVKTFLASL